jgi:class 3 adenylate cyclase
MLWEQQPAAMQVALARHDTVLHQAIKASLGFIVKTTGDGVIAVFGTATDALEACVAAQRALQAPQAALSSPDPMPV